MKRILNVFGVVVFAAAFLGSAGWVLARRAAAADKGITIQFAHWQLESGLREAFDRLAAEYMATHPGVRVKQRAVPGRVYTTWLQTGYVGDTMPDLVSLGSVSDEVLASHHRSLTREVALPNPYNAGTPLEGVPWRETFLDGLEGSAGLRTLQEYYSIPCAIMTLRMYYNRPLWKEIFGSKETPRDFAGFLEACRAVEDFSRRTGRAVLPIAGSRFTANVLFESFFRTQTQRRALELDRLHSLGFAGDAAAPSVLSFLPGLARIDEPAVRDGLALVREVGKHMQPGFLQLDRDDAILYFAQGRALMLPTGVWDYGSIAEQSSFEIGVFPVPLPSRDDPQFGRNVLGPTSEAAVRPGAGFYVSARSKHPEVAIDFLQFMSSFHGNQLFARESKWPPVIVGVEPAKETRAFAPLVEGWTRGFIIAPIMWGSGEIYRIQYQNFDRLLGPDGSVEKFLHAIRSKFPAAVREDLRQQIRQQGQSVELLDGVACGARQSGDRDRFSALLQAQNAQESMLGWLGDRWRALDKETP